jgi:hypothetical protein
MRNAILLALLVAACGNDNPDGKQPDAGIDGLSVDTPTANATVTITGKATEQTTSGSTNLQGVVIKAFRSSDETTPVAMTTTDASGNYSITLTTGGVALDGYLSASKAGLLDTYLYPPYPVFEDFAGASVIMVTMDTWDALSTLGGGNQQAGNGLIALIVTDGVDPVGGAVVTSNPAGTKVSYNAMAGTLTLPSSSATMTHTDGIAYLYNVPVGGVTVSATKTGSTFSPHPVKARADVVTTTLITP